MLALIVVLVGAVVLAHSAPFPFLLEAFRPKQSLWRVPSAPGEPPTIYLTFDDGPNPAATAALLDVLRDHQVPATFFLIDEHVTEETAPLIRRMFAMASALSVPVPAAHRNK